MRRSGKLTEVTTIDAALNLYNFDSLQLPPATESKDWTAKLGAAKSKTAESIVLTDKQQEYRGRQRQCDIFWGEYLV